MGQIYPEWRNADEAFESYYEGISIYGESFQNTKAYFNVGFYIMNPLENKIKIPFRNWNESYAEQEWQWYLSGDPSVEEIQKRAKIWEQMHNGDYIVNSNYGQQWKRNNQFDYVINELKRDITSRRAFITIYDAKEHHLYSKDTPCTLNIGFQYFYDRLNMSVIMRSNDLWFGFCNDQYCFSKLFEMVSKELNVEMGSYFHYAANLHIYNDKLGKNVRGNRF